MKLISEDHAIWSKFLVPETTMTDVAWNATLISGSNAEVGENVTDEEVVTFETSLDIVHHEYAGIDLNLAEAYVSNITSEVVVDFLIEDVYLEAKMHANSDEDDRFGVLSARMPLPLSTRYAVLKSVSPKVEMNPNDEGRERQPSFVEGKGVFRPNCRPTSLCSQPWNAFLGPRFRPGKIDVRSSSHSGQNVATESRINDGIAVLEAFEAEGDGFHVGEHAGFVLLTGMGENYSIAAEFPSSGEVNLTRTFSMQQDLGTFISVQAAVEFSDPELNTEQQLPTLVRFSPGDLSHSSPGIFYVRTQMALLADLSVSFEIRIGDELGHGSTKHWEGTVVVRGPEVIAFLDAQHMMYDAERGDINVFVECTVLIGAEPSCANPSFELTSDFEYWPLVCSPHSMGDGHCDYDNQNAWCGWDGGASAISASDCCEAECRTGFSLVHLSSRCPSTCRIAAFAAVSENGGSPPHATYIGQGEIRRGVVKVEDDGGHHLVSSFDVATTMFSSDSNFGDLSTAAWESTTLSGLQDGLAPHVSSVAITNMVDQPLLVFAQTMDGNMFAAVGGTQFDEGLSFIGHLGRTHEVRCSALDKIHGATLFLGFRPSVYMHGVEGRYGLFDDFNDNIPTLEEIQSSRLPRFGARAFGGTHHASIDARNVLFASSTRSGKIRLAHGGGASPVDGLRRGGGVLVTNISVSFNDGSRETDGFLEVSLSPGGNKRTATPLVLSSVESYTQARVRSAAFRQKGNVDVDDDYRAALGGTRAVFGNSLLYPPGDNKMVIGPEGKFAFVVHSTRSKLQNKVDYNIEIDVLVQSEITGTLSWASTTVTNVINSTSFMHEYAYFTRPSNSIDAAISSDGANLYVIRSLEGPRQLYYALIAYKLENLSGNLRLVEVSSRVLTYDEQLDSYCLFLDHGDCRVVHSDEIQLDGASSIEVASRHVYVSSRWSKSVSLFERDVGTGALVFKSRVAQDSMQLLHETMQQCDITHDFVTTPMLCYLNIAASNDLKFLYILAGSYESNALMTYSRNGLTGDLIRVDALSDIAFLNGANSLCIFGSNIYVTTFWNDSLVVFDRDVESGRPSMLQVLRSTDEYQTDTSDNDQEKRCEVSFYGPVSVAITSDGLAAYVVCLVASATNIFAWDFSLKDTVTKSNASTVGTSLISLSRDSETGKLDFFRRLDQRELFNSSSLRFDSHFQVAPNPFGHHVYVHSMTKSGEWTVSTFARRDQSHEITIKAQKPPNASLELSCSVSAYGSQYDFSSFLSATTSHGSAKLSFGTESNRTESMPQVNSEADVALSIRLQLSQKNQLVTIGNPSVRSVAYDQFHVPAKQLARDNSGQLESRHARSEGVVGKVVSVVTIGDNLYAASLPDRVSVYKGVLHSKDSIELVEEYQFGGYSASSSYPNGHLGPSTRAVLFDSTRFGQVQQVSASEDGQIVVVAFSAVYSWTYDRPPGLGRWKQCKVFLGVKFCDDALDESDTNTGNLVSFSRDKTGRLTSPLLLSMDLHVDVSSMQAIGDYVMLVSTPSAIVGPSSSKRQYCEYLGLSERFMVAHRNQITNTFRFHGPGINLGKCNGVNVQSHMVVSPAASSIFIYVASQLQQSLFVLEWNFVTKEYKIVQKIERIKADYTFAPQKVALDPSGSYIYVTTIESVVVAFKRDAVNGTLTYLDFLPVPAFENTPKAFGITGHLITFEENVEIAVSPISGLLYVVASVPFCKDLGCNDMIEWAEATWSVPVTAEETLSGLGIQRSFTVQNYPTEAHNVTVYNQRFVPYGSQRIVVNVYKMRSDSLVLLESRELSFSESEAAPDYALSSIAFSPPDQGDEALYLGMTGVGNNACPPSYEIKDAEPVALAEFWYLTYSDNPFIKPKPVLPVATTPNASISGWKTLVFPQWCSGALFSLKAKKTLETSGDI